MRINVVHNCFQIGDLFEHKEHQPKLLRSNAVYKLTCSGDTVYIGQTRRNLRARLDDHTVILLQTQITNLMWLNTCLKTLHILITLSNQKFYVRCVI